MPRPRFSRSLLAAGALASAVTPLLATTALAQSSSAESIDPRLGSYAAPGQSDTYPNGAPMPEPAPPPGYDGTRLPPPPPGYSPAPDERSDINDRYAADAERWARENCVKSKGDVAGGAIIGGIFGAIIGSALGGRHDGGGAAVAGAAVGAVGGAAIASNSGNETSPGCPPGYVVRRGAVQYSYSGPDFYYAAPGWYRPWVYYGDRWTYRPYPYHDWYYRTYRGGGDHHAYPNGAPRGDWRGGEGWRNHDHWDRRGH